MIASGVHHVAICVHDVDVARRFYVEVLGMRERVDRPDFGFPGTWLDVGGQQVHLMQVEAMPPGAAAQHFALRVDDLDAAVAAVEARGIGIHRVPHVLGAGQQAFLTDPSGNGIELNQPDS